MTMHYSSRANTQLTPFSSTACLHVSQSHYSLTVYGGCTSELHYQLSQHFHVTQYRDGQKTDSAEVDAGLIDCRSAAIHCPRASESVSPSLFFMLINGDSYFPSNTEALPANVELITETEISNGVLKLRLDSHRQQQSQQNDNLISKVDNHQIRQPLHAIGLFASSLELVLSDNAQKATLSKILNSCNELNNLFNTKEKSVKPGSEPVHSTDGSLDKKGNLSAQAPKVMLIDDDPAVLDATHLLLTEMNCETYPANNIPEALEILQELDELPDLLIVDYDLGDNTTGEIAIEEICAAAGSQLPAIMVSGSIDQMKKIQDNRGISKVLSKPVDAGVLLKTINNTVAQKYG